MLCDQIIRDELVVPIEALFLCKAFWTLGNNVPLKISDEAVMLWEEQVSEIPVCVGRSWEGGPRFHKTQKQSSTTYSTIVRQIREFKICFKRGGGCSSQKEI